MPRLIAPGSGAAFGIDALVDALDAHPFDTRDEDSFADAGPLLARLGRNPHFLADLAIAELKDRCAAQVATNGYSAQVVLLRPPSARYVLRANFWPAATDDAVRISGADAFFYGDAHDHNFPFLTYGYLGPGYWSDYYERDPAAVLGLPGERAHLRFVERARLEPGRLMLYRQRLDVHRQLPPEAFSVSLNILGHDPAQPWIDQYRFDIDTDTVVGGLTVAPSEALLALAVQFGNGIDVVETLARRHPFARMRTTALDALLGAGQGHALAEEAVADSDRLVAAHARRRLAAIEATGSDAIAA